MMLKKMSGEYNVSYGDLGRTSAMNNHYTPLRDTLTQRSLSSAAARHARSPTNKARTCGRDLTCQT